MGVKDGLVGDVVMWGFLGAAAVLVITHANGFSTAVGTAAAPVEYMTGTIASAGANVGNVPGSAAPYKA